MVQKHWSKTLQLQKKKNNTWFARNAFRNRALLWVDTFLRTGLCQSCQVVFYQNTQTLTQTYSLCRHHEIKRQICNCFRNKLAFLLVFPPEPSISVSDYLQIIFLTWDWWNFKVHFCLYWTGWKKWKSAELHIMTISAGETSFAI